MILRAEVTEEGVLRIKSPNIQPGDEILIETSDHKPKRTKTGRWSSIKAAFERTDSVSVPIRTHEEILKELHEIRGNQ